MIVERLDDQVGSRDEYDIALEEGVEDETLLSTSDTRQFTITSYGADYTVDSLVKRMKGGAFTIPDFQRRFVWSQRHASKFIESLLMGLPVPGIFLYKESGTNKHLVIDGQQRLRTLQYFYDKLFHDKKFKLIDVRQSWINKTYDDLEPEDQLKLDDSIVHATIFTQEKPADVLDSIFFVFERINSGGIRLSPQEIRNCISAGPFIELVKKLNKDMHWRNVFGGAENPRAKDEELIIRFFALLEDRSKYSRPMAKFLNEYADSMNSAPEKQLRRLQRIFVETIALVDESLNGRAFRPVRALNAAVFDSTMVGIATRITQGTNPKPRSVAKAYDRLLSDEQYTELWQKSTSDEENVKKRLDLAVVAFKSI